MMNSKLTAERLRRRAIVYVRQSSPGQVIHNQESQRRQYGLVDYARELGFCEVSVIDDDLGRSGSGLMERPGFQKLVTEVCSGEVGAIFCIEASRLARNGRDWHHLIELCGMTGAVVIDPDGIYDPTFINDRLLLGLKGTMSEFELNLLRQRSLEAIRQKARRGELRFHLPIGFIWSESGKVEMDPDRRVQQAISLVFAKMTELGSMRQVLLWFRHEKVCLPAKVEGPGHHVIWKLPVYNTIWHMMQNAMYAGAYVFGKTESRTKIIDGRSRKTVGHPKSKESWTVLIQDHHPGYISWEQYERNQQMIAANSNMKWGASRKAGRGGRSLLAGLLRCRRCGRMLQVTYSGNTGRVPRYHCKGAHINHGEDWCISFGGLRVDEAVAQQIVDAISGNAVEAALDAAEQLRRSQQQQRKTLDLEAEQARYEARLAARRYENIDPDNRLVAAELEARWNAALQRVQELDHKLQQFDSGVGMAPIPDKDVLLSLAQDLPAVWNAASSDMRVKQRIVRILVEEIVADVDEKNHEIMLLIHWAGGRHSELRIKKNQSGQHRHRTSMEAIAVIKQMATDHTDEQIATTLNQLGFRTGAGHSWNHQRVNAARRYHNLAVYDPQRWIGYLTLERAAERLGISANSVRRMIKQEKLQANQVLSCAPWRIPIAALESDAIQQAAHEIKHGKGTTRTQFPLEQDDLFSTA
jgi:DNA invertase Pin-like site-specific DNA recombinase